MKKDEKIEIRVSSEMKERIKEKGNISKYILSLVEKDMKGELECQKK